MGLPRIVKKKIKFIINLIIKTMSNLENANVKSAEERKRAEMHRTYGMWVFYWFYNSRLSTTRNHIYTLHHQQQLVNMLSPSKYLAKGCH